MRPLDIFPQPIWKATFPGRIDKIVEKALRYKSDGHGVIKKLAGHTQKYDVKNYPHEWEELDEFNKWFSNCFQTIWKNWEYKLESWQEIRFKSWVNYNNKNDYLLEHTHPYDVMTIIFYIKKPSNGGDLQILSPLLYHWQNNADTKFWRDVPANEKDVIIIPGWMMHKVSVNKSDEERISITINAEIINKEKDNVR